MSKIVLISDTSNLIYESFKESLSSYIGLKNLIYLKETNTIVQKLKDAAVDVVFLEYTEHSKELLSVIRGDSLLSHLIIILTYGGKNKLTLPFAKELGADDILEKPFEVIEVRQKLDRFYSEPTDSKWINDFNVVDSSMSDLLFSATNSEQDTLQDEASSIDDFNKDEASSIDDFNKQEQNEIHANFNLSSLNIQDEDEGVEKTVDEFFSSIEEGIEKKKNKFFSDVEDEESEETTQDENSEETTQDNFLSNVEDENSEESKDDNFFSGIEDEDGEESKDDNFFSGIEDEDGEETIEDNFLSSIENEDNEESKDDNFFSGIEDEDNEEPKDDNFFSGIEDEDGEETIEDNFFSSIEDKEDDFLSNIENENNPIMSDLDVQNESDFAFTPETDLAEKQKPTKLKNEPVSTDLYGTLELPVVSGEETDNSAFKLDEEKETIEEPAVTDPFEEYNFTSDFPTLHEMTDSQAEDETVEEESSLFATDIDTNEEEELEQNFLFEEGIEADQESDFIMEEDSNEDQESDFTFGEVGEDSNEEEQPEPDFTFGEVGEDSNEEEQLEPDFTFGEVGEDSNEEEQLEPDFTFGEVEEDSNEEEQLEPDFTFAEDKSEEEESEFMFAKEDNVEVPLEPNFMFTETAEEEEEQEDGLEANFMFEEETGEKTDDPSLVEEQNTQEETDELAFSPFEERAEQVEEEEDNFVFSLENYKSNEDDTFSQKLKEAGVHLETKHRRATSDISIPSDDIHAHIAKDVFALNDLKMEDIISDEDDDVSNGNSNAGKQDLIRNIIERATKDITKIIQK